MSMPMGAKKSTYLRKSPKWVPKKWKPAYGTIVLLHVQALSNKEIGDKLGYSEQQISNILNCSEARKMKEKIATKLEEELLEQTNADLKSISRRAIHNIKQVIYSDDLLEKAPMAMFDRSAMFLKAVGTIKDPDAEKKSQQTNILIGNDVIANLIDGLTKANRVAERHALPSSSSTAVVRKENEIIQEVVDTKP